MGSLCRTRTQRGGQCRRLVRATGEHCYWHPGGRPVPIPRRPSRRRRRPGQGQRALEIDRYAVTTTELMTAGWPRTAASVFTRAVGARWQEAARQWRPDRCGMLAALARRLLDERGQEAVITAAARLIRTDRESRVERHLARALAQRISLPGEAGIRAAANALRAAGVCLCLSEDQDLHRCTCFEDLSQTGDVDQITEILRAALVPLDRNPDTT